MYKLFKILCLTFYLLFYLLTVGSIPYISINYEHRFLVKPLAIFFFFYSPLKLKFIWSVLPTYSSPSAMRSRNIPRNRTGNCENNETFVGSKQFSVNWGFLKKKVSRIHLLSVQHQWYVTTKCLLLTKLGDSKHIKYTSWYAIHSETTVLVVISIYNLSISLHSKSESLSMTFRNFVLVSSISSSSYVYCRLVAALVTLRRVRPE